jgi:hypothetical protein
LVDTEQLLEAKATVRYLEYKKIIESQQTTTLNSLYKTVNDSHFQESAKNINRSQVVDKIKQSDNEIKDLNQNLRDAVTEKLSIEKDVCASQHQHEQIQKLKTVIEIQKTTLGYLDQQEIRYETVQLSAEKDRKLLSNLQRRVDMLDQLLTNDAKSTDKIKEIISFEARGDYCPSQLENHQPIDKRDQLLNTLKDILQTETSTSSISDDRVSPQSLVKTAADSKRSCDSHIDALADVLLTLQSTVQHSEAKFTALINDCKRVEEASSSTAVQEHFRRHNKHTSKITALLSDLKMKIDTRYCCDINLINLIC